MSSMTRREILSSAVVPFLPADPDPPVWGLCLGLFFWITVITPIRYEYFELRYDIEPKRRWRRSEIDPVLRDPFWKLLLTPVRLSEVYV